MDQLLKCVREKQSKKMEKVLFVFVLAIMCYEILFCNVSQNL